MSDILDTPKTEHGRLLELFARINTTTDSQAHARNDLLKRIEAAFIPRAKWEETAFYPEFEKRAGPEQKLIHVEALHDHRAVGLAVLPDLHAADADSRQFAGPAQVRGGMIKHHAHEEATRMFELFGAEELAELDARYARREEIPAAEAIDGYARLKTSATAMMRNPV